MAGNLKARLARIRTGETPRTDAESKAQNIPPRDETKSGQMAEKWPGWIEAGHMTLKREFRRPLKFGVPDELPDALAVIVPDFARQRIKGDQITADDLLLFDLETTGLSGGAGTIAFLAAFGRFVPPAEIAITQYLLLDYPGEPDFLELVVGEFAANAPPYMVSYNGKSFDSQILRSRLLMNGIRPPEFKHADLLHPARRLWKRKLADCSQATIEVEILGLDRTGDVSGALAPEIWFSFLRDGEPGELLSICEHNAKDIAGLATIFLAMNEIARNPTERVGPFNYDMETLALAWHDTIRRNRLHYLGADAGNEIADTGERLLTLVAESGHPRAAVVMAKIAEWRKYDFNLALRYTELALDNCGDGEGVRDELMKRRARLEKKLAVRRED